MTMANKQKKKTAESKKPTSKRSRQVRDAEFLQIEPQILIPVTAVGASAGGLEPIEQFFDAMPADSGCAFVIIQHLSPDFRSLMDELLARHSTMKIYKIEDGMEIMPNSIFLNTPRTVMTLEGNQLQVKKVNTEDNVYLPIDIFFESLARNRGEQAVGIVLSGTGSDGTKGSAFINKVGGSILVQNPETTRFDGMPRSVLANGHSTLVASPVILARCVERLLKKESLEGLDASTRMPITDPLSDVLSMLKHTHGTDFLQYKDATIHRRIERRAQMRGLTDIDDYRDILTVDKHELHELYADLLIEVTEFFRDQAAFEVLENDVIPKLIDHQSDGGSLRVWVPGCASGEEAYSIAILLQEYARGRGIFLHLKIMATDIHVRSMNQASSGIYHETALKNVPAEIVERYFDCADGQAQIKPQLRNMVFFSTHDLTRDPPFTRIDLISCRNLLIYLKEDAQEKVMNLLHFSLRKDGYLFLGPSEHIGAISHEFEPVNEKWRMYRKLRDVKLLSGESIFHRTDFASNVTRSSNHQRSSSKADMVKSDESIPFKRAHRTALESIVERHAPPGFLLGEDGVIVHIFGNAGELIPLQAGSFSRRLVDMIMPELKVIVTTALDHGRHHDFTEFSRSAYIRAEGEAPVSYEVTLSNVEVPGEALKFQLLTVEKLSLKSKKTGPSVPISQEEMEAFDSSEILRQRISSLEHSLQSSEESLQSTIEELETSNEELQSTNEELMSTNEELQSTNEELHSVNEELYTVSAEHQRKNEDLTERDTDIDVLLQASKIGTIHLDEELRLRRYSNNARSVFNILPQDVGRPINHITIRSAGESVIELAEQVNQAHETYEKIIQIEDETFLLRFMPYRARQDHPCGVLITVIDITDFETVSAELADLNIHYRDIVEKTETALVRWSAQTSEITYCNPLYASRWGMSAEELIGQEIYKLYNDDDERNMLQGFVGSIEPEKMRSFVQDYNDHTGKVRSMSVSIRAISSDGADVQLYQASGQDLTEEAIYRISLEQLFSAFTDDGIGFDEKIDRLLRVGCNYFELDRASLGMIMGDSIQVISVFGEAVSSEKPGDTVLLSETFSGRYFDNQACLANDSISENMSNLTERQLATGIESYIGAAVHNGSGPYGTVDFYSKKSRGRFYSSREESFAMLLGSWLGFLVEQQEHKEFMSKQTEHYKSLFHNVPVMMFLSDKDGLIISASDRLCSKLGVESDTLPGNNCLKVLSINETTKLKAALADGNVSRLPFTMQTYDGVTLEIELNSSIKPIGTLQGVRMVVLIDVSERNMALRDSEGQNKRLEAANESLNQFAFIASHDLQEPLRKIQQFSSFLEEDLEGQLTGDGRFHLDTIVDASARMSTLIYDLLSYSGASKEEPKLETISLNKMMTDVLDELELSVQESAADIFIGSLPDIEGDKMLVRQLMTNLLSNSIKYRSDNRPLKISLEGFGIKNKEGVRIVDNGIGFDMEFSKKIFDPFNRLHNSKDYKGNGIGLAICSTVCDKHNWTLSTDSKVNVGSTFIITFAP